MKIEDIGIYEYKDSNSAPQTLTGLKLFEIE